MKRLVLIIVLLNLLALSGAFGQPAPVKPRITPATISASPGDLIVISAEKAKGDVAFFWDARDFGAKRCFQSGKTLVLTTDRTGSYSVNCVSWDDRTIEQVLILVDGHTPNPLPDPPAPPTPSSRVGIVLIKDSKADNSDQLILLAQGKAWVEAKGHTTWVRDVHSSVASGYSAEATAVGLPALIFIKADGTRIGKAIRLPTDLDAIKKVVKDHGGLVDAGPQWDVKGDYVLHAGVKRYLTAKRTAPATMKRFRRYGEAWPILPADKWKDFSMADLAPPRILDQDGTGACVGHGAVGAFEFAWRFNGRQHLEFSPWFVYGNINGGMDQGAYVGDSLFSLQQKGVCLWSSVPYGEYRATRFPANAFKEATRFKPDLVHHCGSWEEVCSAVQRGHPVVFGVEIGSGFEPDARGIIPDRRGSGGGHCMFACGVKQFAGKWHLHVVNSWGTAWGKNGTCFMPKTFFDADDLADAYAIVTPQNDPQDPLPLPKLK